MEGVVFLPPQVDSLNIFITFSILHPLLILECSKLFDNFCSVALIPFVYVFAVLGIILASRSKLMILALLELSTSNYGYFIAMTRNWWW